MDPEMIKFFEGKRVKLNFKVNNFVLVGFIKKVSISDDAFIFSTDQKTSLIRFDQIQQITEINGE